MSLGWSILLVPLLLVSMATIGSCEESMDSDLSPVFCLVVSVSMGTMCEVTGWGWSTGCSLGCLSLTWGFALWRGSMVSPLVGFLSWALGLGGSMARPSVVSVCTLYWGVVRKVGRLGLVVQHGLEDRTANWTGPCCVVCVGS